MALPMDKPVPESACNAPRVARGLKWLLAAHLVLSLTPAVPLLQVDPAHNWFCCARTLTMGIPAAQLLLLIFWVGMGTSRLGTRLVGGVLGAAFRGLMANLSFLLIGAPEFIGSAFEDYPKTCLWNSLVVLSLAGLCRLIWGRFAELRCLPSPEKTLPHAWFRFSIRHILALTAVVAILLGLACSVRPPRAGRALLEYPMFLKIGVPLVSVYGAWAALGLGRLRWQIPLVMLVTIVLVGAEMWVSNVLWTNVSLFVDAILVSLPLTFTTVATVVGSLLVVRSCGYRLIPKDPSR